MTLPRVKNMDIRGCIERRESFQNTKGTLSGKQVLQANNYGPHIQWYIVHEHARRVPLLAYQYDCEVWFYCGETETRLSKLCTPTWACIAVPAQDFFFVLRYGYTTMVAAKMAGQSLAEYTEKYRFGRRKRI